MKVDKILNSQKFGGRAFWAGGSLSKSVRANRRLEHQWVDQPEWNRVYGAIF